MPLDPWATVWICLVYCWINGVNMTGSLDTSWQAGVKRPIVPVVLFCIAFMSLMCEPVWSHELCSIFGSMALAASSVLACKFEMPPITGERSCQSFPVMVSKGPISGN